MLPVLGIVIVPGILWGWFFYNFQRYKKVRISLLLILFICGMGSGFLALILNHIIEKYTIFWPGAAGYNLDFLGKKIYILSSGFWFIVGFNEELAKILVLLTIVFSSSHLEEKFDGILFSVIVALGFAVMENLYYLDHYGIAVVIMRTVITVPAHAFMSVPMGFFVAKSRLAIDSRSESKYRLLHPLTLLFSGWLFSSFLHGFYDLLLSLNMEKEAYSFIVLMGIISYLFIKLAIKSSKIKFLKLNSHR